jgi:hypothetical protein
VDSLFILFLLDLEHFHIEVFLDVFLLKLLLESLNFCLQDLNLLCIVYDYGAWRLVIFLGFDGKLFGSIWDTFQHTLEPYLRLCDLAILALKKSLDEILRWSWLAVGRA